MLSKMDSHTEKLIHSEAHRHIKDINELRGSNILIEGLKGIKEKAMATHSSTLA